MSSNERSKLSILIRPFLWGWRDDLPSAENRLTTVVNIYAVIGLLALLFTGLHVYSIGSPLALWYIFPWNAAAFCLWLNAHGHIRSARIVMVIMLNMVALFAGLFFGTQFNGYLTFFLALLFSLFLIGKLPSVYVAACVTVSFMGLPLMDVLSSYHIIPLLEIPQKLVEQGLVSRLFDTFVIGGIFILAMTADRWHSHSHERRLEEWNELLDRKVKEKTQELVRAKELAEQSSLLKSQFIANISHELRIPMQAIMGFTHLAKVRLESDKHPLKETITSSKECLEHVETASRRLYEFLLPLFEMTSSPLSTIGPHPSSGCLQGHIQNVLSEFERQRINKDLTVEMNYEAPEEITTDFGLLTTALRALFDNAFKFAAPSSTIKIHVRDIGADCVIDITNTGVGIAEKDLASIFEPFTQGSNVTMKAGAGLGLYRAKRYLQAIGGLIQITSSNSESTTFQIRIPRGL